MKRATALVVLVGFVALVLAAPVPAAAGHRGHGSPGGYFWGGLAVGAVTGLVVGGAFAPRVYAAPPVVYQPAPVYVAPPPPVVYQPAPVYAVPAPVCADQWVGAYWYGGAWVPGYWQRVCR